MLFVRHVSAIILACGSCHSPTLNAYTDNFLCKLAWGPMKDFNAENTNGIGHMSYILLKMSIKILRVMVELFYWPYKKIVSFQVTTILILLSAGYINQIKGYRIKTCSKGQRSRGGEY